MCVIIWAESKIFQSTNFESCFLFFQLVTSTTDGDAKSRTKTEQEETCSKEVTSGGDGETFTISNTSTSRTTKTVASSNLPLPPDTDEAPSTDAKATDVTEEKQVHIHYLSCSKISHAEGHKKSTPSSFQYSFWWWAIFCPFKPSIISGIFFGCWKHQEANQPM